MSKVTGSEQTKGGSRRNIVEDKDRMVEQEEEMRS